MMPLFDQTTLECSKIVTLRYSTSFSLGIKLLDKKYHFPIYAIYGFVRYADEIVDTFYGYNQKQLLDQFEKDTYEAIEKRISLNPILHSFQWMVNKYLIERELIEAFLYSMRMDLDKQTYDDSKYKAYIYGSAEVVGLMCLRVFCEGNQAQYDSLKEGARRLGAAFQKVNFLRDLKSDFIDRGRVYFPSVDFSNFDKISKQNIEADIQADFDAGYAAIKKLPISSQKGVNLAYQYYQALFNKIKNTPSQKIQEQRIRVPDFTKIILLAKTFLRYQFTMK